MSLARALVLSVAGSLVSGWAGAESVRPWIGAGGSVSPLSGSDILSDSSPPPVEHPLGLGLSAEFGLMVPPIPSVIPSVAALHDWTLDPSPPPGARGLDSRQLVALLRVRVVLAGDEQRLLAGFGFGYGGWWQYNPAGAGRDGEALHARGLAAELGLAYQTDLSSSFFLEGSVGVRGHRARATNGAGYFADAALVRLSMPVAVQLGYVL